MQITSTQKARPPIKPQTPAESKPASSDPQQIQDSFEPGWAEAGISVAAGVASAVGAFSDQPLLAIGGLAVTTVTSSLAAYRTQANGSMDTAAKVTFAATGLAAGSQLLAMAMPEPVPQPNGPLPQLMQRLGISHLHL